MIIEPLHICSSCQFCHALNDPKTTVTNTKWMISRLRAILDSTSVPETQISLFSFMISCF